MGVLHLMSALRLYIIQRTITKMTKYHSIYRELAVRVMIFLYQTGSHIIDLSIVQVDCVQTYSLIIATGVQEVFTLSNRRIKKCRN